MSSRSWAVAVVTAATIYGVLAWLGLGAPRSQVLIAPGMTVLIVVVIEGLERLRARAHGAHAVEPTRRVRLRAVATAVGLVIAGLVVSTLIERTIGAGIAIVGLVLTMVLAYGGWISRPRGSVHG